MRLRVLVVDDQEDMRRALRRELAKEFEIVDAASADEAKAKLDDGIAAVVTDFAMGDGDNGDDLLRHVRERLPGVARVLVSGAPGASRDTKLDAAEMRFDKPWKPGAILAYLVSRVAARG